MDMDGSSGRMDESMKASGVAENNMEWASIGTIKIKKREDSGWRERGSAGWNITEKKVKGNYQLFGPFFVTPLYE